MLFSIKVTENRPTLDVGLYNGKIGGVTKTRNYQGY